MRLSEVQIYSKIRAPKTWLDDYELRENKVDQKYEKFELERTKMKALGTAQGQIMVQKTIKKSLDSKFLKLNFNPYDVKVLNYPIDFVVFNGRKENNVTDVNLLTYKSTNKILQKLHKDIENVIQQKSYDWKEVNISKDGQQVTIS